MAQIKPNILVARAERPEFPLGVAESIIEGIVTVLDSGGKRRIYDEDALVPLYAEMEAYVETPVAIPFMYLVVRLLPGGQPQTQGHAHAGFMIFDDAIEWVAAQPGSPYIVIDAITGKIVPGQ